jgi:hypothetical protein
MDVIDSALDNALGNIASGINQTPTRTQMLTSMLRGQPSFSDTPMIPPQQQSFAPTPAANPNGYRLPRAMAAAGSQPQPQPSPQIQAPTLPPQESVPRAAPDPVMAQYEDLSRRRAAAEAEMDKTYAPVDRAAATKAYQEHVEGGDRALTLALAASQAGDRFKPLQQQFLKQYGEAQAPMHVAGGIYTPQGFIEDVDKVSTQNQQRLQARLASLDNALNVNLTAQERVRIEAMKEDTQRQLHQLMVGTQVAIAQAMSADRRYAADLAHADRQAALDAKGNGPGKILPAATIATLNTGIAKGEQLSRLGQEFKPEYSGWEGTAMNLAGKLPMVDTAAAEWWRNYAKQNKLPERHELFGGALTPGEARSWDEADISPTMAPAAIQRNIARRNEIFQTASNRAIQTLRDSGYNTEAYPNYGLPQAPPPAAPAAPVTDRRKSPRPAAGGVVDFNALPKGQ